ncbi:hypothetical protein GZ77_25190 [Endozoicomonas montiporae]|uniref:Major facilitator superfamily (MFS) profile domain-containing protein n=2 Tax=Endozoicomonas montiporae TaxID=1027273 RepID=A0A081MYY4_9GAMM|nr:hypothetical protein GZ77_25190 [Endozoicomonas montiporae]
MLPVTFFLPILPDIARSLAVSSTEFQLALPLFVLTQVFAMPVVALLSDAGFRLHCLYWSLVVFVTGTLCCLVSVETCLFFIGRALQGVASAGLMTVVPAMVNECYEDNEVARVLSYITAIGFIVPMAGAELGTFIASCLSWQYVYAIILVYAVVVSLVCRRMLKKPEPAHPVDCVRYYKSCLWHWKSMLTDRYTLAFLICNTGVAIVCQIYVSNSAFLYLEYFKLRPITYSYLLSVLYLSRMLVSVFNGLLLKRHDYLYIVHHSIPLLIFLTLLTTVMDLIFHQADTLNQMLPIMLFALSGFILTNTLAGVLQNNDKWAMQAVSLMFILFSSMASIVNIFLIVHQDGTPKVLSLFSLLVLVITYLVFLGTLPAHKRIR